MTIYVEAPLDRPRLQWSAIVAAALAGFATAVVMTTLGGAIGMTAGAAAADEPVSADRAAAAVGIGAAIWILLTAVTTGVVAGAVLSRTSRSDLPYHPTLFGTLAWAGGIALMLTASSPALGSLVGAGGGAAGAAAAVAANEPRGVALADRDFRAERAPADANFRREPLTDAEAARARQRAEDAAKAAALAAWLAVIGQLVALGATVLVASKTHRLAPVVVPPAVPSPG